MHSTHLREHDANQGAQSAGEFLGMTGNCGWYLLAAAGTTILMVIFLWGILGVSLLLCLLVGLLLCGGSAAYVFAFKNNKPRHYDTDFLEAALVEAGVLQFRFGPREGRWATPFYSADPAPVVASGEKEPSPKRRALVAAHGNYAEQSTRVPGPHMPGVTNEDPQREQDGPVVSRAVYERLHEKLATTEEMLEDALAERGED